MFAADPETQVGLSTVLAGLSSVATLVLGGFVVLLRIIMTRYEERIRDTEKSRDDFRERLHKDEVDTTRQDGEIRLLKQTLERHSADAEEMRDRVVPRTEWEQRMGNLERMVREIMVTLSQRPGLRGPTTYSSASELGATPQPRPERGGRGPGESR